MPAFGLTPLPPFATQGEDFPTGIQFQTDGENLGPPNPQFVSLNGLGQTGTYDSITGTVNYDISGGGSGVTPSSSVVGFRAHKTSIQTTGQTVVFQDVSAPGFMTDNCYNVVNGVFTCPAGLGGLWRFASGVQVSNSGGEASPAFVDVDILLSITAVSHDEQLVGDSGILQNYAEFALADGDQVQVVRSGTSWSVNVSVDAATYCFFSGVRVGDVAGGGG